MTIGTVVLYGLAAYGVFKIVNDRGVSLNDQYFDDPIKTKKVKKGIVAEQYRTGIIKIDGKKYSGYSMTEAIKKYKRETRNK